ncbi:hypothetical protein Tco_1281255, partial [Tanacetum coccineum]
MAQQIIPAAQRVLKFQGIGRSTIDIPAVYLQQFWKIVHKVPNTKDTIRFNLDTQEITYTVDMFRATLQLPMETQENPFVAPVNIKIIESFMHTVGYQGVVDKVSAFYTKFLAQPWQTMFKIVYHKRRMSSSTLISKLNIADLMKKFTSIPPRFEEDYHSIKDDISLISVYTTGNVTVRGMLIPDAFLTEEICATNDYKEYETVFGNVVVLMNQPRMKQVVEGEKDVESYADKFAASMIHDDVDDSGDRIEPESHKEHPEVVDVEDDKKEEKKDEMGSLETRTKKIQTPISTTPRSPRIILSSD